MTLEEMLVRLKADNKDFKAKMQEAQKAAKETDKALNGMGKTAGKAASSSMDKSLEKTRTLREEIKRIRDESKKMVGIRPSDVYKKTTADIEKMSAALEKLKAKQSKTSMQLDAVGATGKGLYDQRKALRERLDQLKAEQVERYGPHPEKSIYAGQSKEWKALQKDIDNTQAKIDALTAKLKTVDQKDLQLSDEFNRLQAEIDQATASLDQYNAKKAQMEASGAATNSAPITRTAAFMQGFQGSDVIPPKIKKIVAMMHTMGKATASAGAGFKKFASTAASAVGGTVGWLKRLSSGFGKVFSKIPLLGKLSGSLTKMKKGMLSGLGLRGMLRFGALGYGMMTAARGAKEGFANIAQYSAQTQASLNSLKSALSTLKNAFASAFAPILNIVAPVLAKVIDWLTGAATAVAHFVAALTGQSTVVVARKAVSGVAAGLGDVGSSADGAKDSVDGLKRSLMGFDQINKLDDTNTGGSGGSGGGGGGAAAAGSMFDTVEVGKGAKGLADAIKESWKNADFTELGAKIGQKLKDALDSIPWTDIQAVGAKVGKSIATGLNGFFETPGLGTSIGNTIAEALNTITITANSFAVNFHWDSLGKTIADGINGFFRTFKFDLAAQTLSNLATGVLDTIGTILEEVKWADVATAVETFVSNINFSGVLSGMARALGGVTGGIAKVIGTWIGDGFTAAKEYFASKIEESGGNVIEGLWKGITDAIANIATWIKTNIFDPFISGFKKAFGIASPSTVMAEQGGYIIEGLLQGLGDKVSTVIDWFKGLPGKIKEAVGEIVFDVKASITNGDAVQKISEAWKGIKGGTKKIAAKAKTSGYKTLKKAKSAWNGIKAGTKRIITRASTSGASSLKSIKDKWNAIKSGTKYLTVKLKGIWEGISSKVKSLLGLESGGVLMGGSWKPVTAAAGGGSFNNGQMFVAREAGPELVGTIGGHTAVMNNDQIVASVSAGVYKAVLAAMSGQGDRPVNITLSADAAAMFRVMQSQARDYTNRTGQSPFPV